MEKTHITVVVGTNRPDSYTEGVAKHYAQLLGERGAQVHLLKMSDLPPDFLYTDLDGEVGPAIQSVVDEFIVPVNKFVFLIPEYNGSYPGVLKGFLDVVPPRNWRDKQAAIIGISSGRAGNLRGQEHLTGVLHYLKVHVHYHKPKLSGIERLASPDGTIHDAHTLRLLEEHAQAVVNW